jgi:hypothetical protein
MLHAAALVMLTVLFTNSSSQGAQHWRALGCVALLLCAVWSWCCDAFPTAAAAGRTYLCRRALCRAVRCDARMRTTGPGAAASAAALMSPGAAAAGASGTRHICLRRLLLLHL